MSSGNQSILPYIVVGGIAYYIFRPRPTLAQRAGDFIDVTQKKTEEIFEKTKKFGGDYIKSQPLSDTVESVTSVIKDKDLTPEEKKKKASVVVVEDFLEQEEALIPSASPIIGVLPVDPIAEIFSNIVEPPSKKSKKKKKKGKKKTVFEEIGDFLGL